MTTFGVWRFMTGRCLAARYQEVIEAATPEAPLWISDITLWEIATLYSLRRIQLELPLRDWLETAVAPPLVQRVSL